MTDNDRKLTFNYIKSPSFETRRVDGCYGGITPTLDLFLATYCERIVIPEVESYLIEPSGSLGSPIAADRISKKGAVREVQVGLTMTVDVAKHIVTFLQEKIAVAEQIQSTAKVENARSSDK